MKALDSVKMYLEVVQKCLFKLRLLLSAAEPNFVQAINFATLTKSDYSKGKGSYYGKNHVVDSSVKSKYINPERQQHCGSEKQLP